MLIAGEQLVAIHVDGRGGQKVAQEAGRRGRALRSDARAELRTLWCGG